MRLPVEMLEPQLDAILEGILLWASDSKNKFKLKVRSCLSGIGFLKSPPPVEAASAGSS